MSSRKFICQLLLISANALWVHGQPISGPRPLPSFDDSIPLTEIIRKTDGLPSNDLKVMSFVAIGRKFLYHGRGKNLDTAVDYMNKAYALSKAIHDTAGLNEALAWLCNLYVNKRDMVSAAAFLPATYGEGRVRFLLTLAQGYIYYKPTDVSFLEKGLSYLERATAMADSLRSIPWRYDCLMLEAKYFFGRGDPDKGRDAILAIIKSCDSLKDLKGVGHYWSEMDTYMPTTRQTIAYHIFADQQAIDAFKQAGDQNDALYTLRDLANNHLYAAAYDSAESELLVFLRETEKLGIKPSTATNLQAAHLYFNKGDFPKALDYGLRALNGLPTDDTQPARRVTIYTALADIYELMNDASEQLKYGKLAVELSSRFNYPDRFYYTTIVVGALIRAGQPKQALQYLQEFNAGNPAGSQQQREAIVYNYCRIYVALGEYNKADSYFRQLTNLDPAAQQEYNVSTFGGQHLDLFWIHLFTARFYVDQGKYQQARPFLEKALADPRFNMMAANESELQWLLFKADSAAGDLRSAIRHYTRHTAIQDSIYDVKKVQQFDALDVQYQTKQKEQSILLLKSESERQRTELKQASFIRKLTIGGIVLLLILAAWAYYAYRAKRRNVTRLLVQQLEINEKNLALEQLVGEKNELITEKNLLLQEVHHRVKNNLHTVMSLLESQSAYLSDKAARNVLLDSQNRIHTISLLHQKLYWSSNVTSLEMAPYIAELCSFLASSLGARERRIAITQSVDAIVLDISLALPIGLLLNEAITNALKHAFPGNTDQHAARSGHINVSMRRLSGEDGLILLQVSDDGVGMSAGKESGSRSLGMILIKSIGQKLGGRFDIRSGAEGVRVELEFKSLSQVLF